MSLNEKVDWALREPTIQEALAIRNLNKQTKLISLLKKARQTANLTVSQVAEKLAVKAETVESIENGSYPITLAEMRLYALAIGAEIDYVVTLHPTE